MSTAIDCFHRLAIGVLTASIGMAQPGIQQNGVVNSASQIAPTLAGGAIARGALFDIYGVRFGSTGHTTIAVSQGAHSVPVPVVSVAARRIQARMPATAPLGSASLIVSVDQRASRAFPIEIAASNPGIFSRNLEGWGPGRIENIDARGAHSPNTQSTPAHPGQRVSLAITGLAAGRRAMVVIGGRAVEAGTAVRGARLAEQEISFQIPGDAPMGCWVPLYLQATPERASNVVTIAIAAPGASCDPGPYSWRAGQKIGLAVLSRTRIKSDQAGTPDARLDQARILFQAVNKDLALSPSRLLPPPGTCTAYTSSYQANTSFSESISSLVALEGRGLDAGTNLTLRRAGVSRTISQVWQTSGTYRSRLGVSGFAARKDSPALFLQPGQYVLAGNGGKEIRGFTSSFSVHEPFEWIDRDQTNTVQRRRGLTLRWRNGSRDDLMIIMARNVDEITTAIGMCLCTVHASDGHFTIPPALLANIPQSQNVVDATLDELAIASLPLKPSAVIQAQGLDSGYVYTVYANERIVEYR